MKFIIGVFILFISSFLLVSCGGDTAQNSKQTVEDTQSKATREIKIKGKIANSLKGSITLEKLDNGQYNKVAENEVSNGQFIIKTNISEPDFYRISLFGGKQYIYVVLNDSDIEVLADASGSEIKYKVNGSKDTDYFREFNLLFEQFKNETQKLNDAYTNANSDSEKESIEKKYKDYQKENVAKIKKMIDTIVPSIAVLYAINVLEIDEEFEYMEKIANLYAEKLPDSRHTKSLVENIKRLKPITNGQKAQEISLKSPDGKTIALSSQKGKLVLIDFWASWCKPCRNENPNVLKVYQKYKDKGFEIYGVSLDKDESKWKQAIKEDQISWLQVLDAQGEFAEKYLVQAIPNTFLIDRDGKIIAKNLRGEALEERVAQELNRPQ